MLLIKTTEGYNFEPSCIAGAAAGGPVWTRGGAAAQYPAARLPPSNYTGSRIISTPPVCNTYSASSCKAVRRNCEK